MAKASRHEVLSRSVDALERLFAVVVALAITIAIQKVLFDKDGKLYVWYDSASKTYPLMKMLLDRLPMLAAFIFSIVPFYHGMNRHLDRIYVERDVPASKAGFLVVDFFVFFLESCLLVAFAALVDTGNYGFIVLVLLLAVDAVWCFATHGIHYGAISPSTIRWGWINSSAVAALLFVYFSNVFPDGGARTWALCGVAIIRTVVDYIVCWDFYFPPSPRP
jgi:hypothetical protein